MRARRCWPGAAPREVMDKVEYADWAPSDTMAVTRDTGVGDRLDNRGDDALRGPRGRFTRSACRRTERASHSGRSFTAPVQWRSSIENGRSDRSRTDGWRLMVSRGQRAAAEVWFAAKSAPRGWGLYSVSTSGELKLLLSLPGVIGLQDLSPEGRALISRNTWQTGIRYLRERCGSRERTLMARRPRRSLTCPTTGSGCCSTRSATPAATTAQSTSAEVTGRLPSGSAQARRWRCHGTESLSWQRHALDRSCVCCRSASGRGGRCRGTSSGTINATWLPDGRVAVRGDGAGARPSGLRAESRRHAESPSRPRA